MGIQPCAPDDKLDMVSAGVHVSALLCGCVCPVAGRYSFYTKVAFLRGGGRIPVMGLGGISSPIPVCSAVTGGGPCACGCLYCGTYRVPRISTCGCMESKDCGYMSPLFD